MEQELLKELAERYPEDILPPFGNMIGDIGFEDVCYLTQKFGGSALYIPTQKRIFGRCLSKQILCDFTGSNYLEVAKKYDLTVRSVQGILERARQKKHQTN